MRRPRGPGGRFLTAKEIAELKEREAAEGGEAAAVAGSSSSAKNPDDDYDPNTDPSLIEMLNDVGDTEDNLMRKK